MEGREKITWVSRLCGYPPICNSQHSQSIYCIVQLLQYKTREIQYYSLLSSQSTQQVLKSNLALSMLHMSIQSISLY